MSDQQLLAPRPKSQRKSPPIIRGLNMTTRRSSNNY